MTVSVDEFIVFWKDAHGQQVNTVVDGHNKPVHRDDAYLRMHGVTVLQTEEEVLSALATADGTKYATSPQIVRATLGWDV